MKQALKHVAIIMDGNGRWAEKRSHPRIWGHVRGSQIVSEIVEEADDLDIKALTLYAFSTENWSRPLLEVKTLFRLLYKFIIRERDRIIANNISFKVIGDISALPAETIALVRNLELQTRSAPGLKLTFAFGYGGRGEIIEAINRIKSDFPDRIVDEDLINQYLMRPEVGDVDLLIRTGGDQRISNFLLWQMAYAELYFTKTKWPEFTRNEFRSIVTDVSLRERRFGGVDTCCSFNTIKQKAQGHKQIIQQLS